MKRKFFASCLAFFTLAFTLNFLWQIYKKPAEVIALLSWSKAKTHQGTWQSYGQSFQKYSTQVITPSFLAALAQIESAGNPLATPQWKFKFTDRLSKIFSPQSSSVGLYQFTNATFKRAQKYCIRDQKVRTANCWMNPVYTRLLPWQSIELASAYLDTEVRRLSRKHKKNLNLKKSHQLAGIIHLCGNRKAEKYIRAGLNVKKIGKCGSHSPRLYLKKLLTKQKAFAQIHQKTKI